LKKGFTRKGRGWVFVKRSAWRDFQCEISGRHRLFLYIYVWICEVIYLWTSYNEKSRVNFLIVFCDFSDFERFFKSSSVVWVGILFSNYIRWYLYFYGFPKSLQCCALMFLIEHEYRLRLLRFCSYLFHFRLAVEMVINLIFPLIILLLRLFGTKGLVEFCSGWVSAKEVLVIIFPMIKDKIEGFGSWGFGRVFVEMWTN